MRNSLRNSMLAGAAATIISAAPMSAYAEMSGGGNSGAPTTAQIKAANLANRQAIVQAALKKQQQIFTNTFNRINDTAVDFPPVK